MRKINLAKRLSGVLPALDYEMAQKVIQALGKDNYILYLSAEQTGISNKSFIFEMEIRLVDRYKYTMDSKVEYLLEAFEIDNFLLQIEIKPTQEELQSYLVDNYDDDFEQEESFMISEEIVLDQLNEGEVAEVFSYFQKINLKWMIEDTQGDFYAGGRKVND